MSPGTSLTGFPPATLTGTKHAGDPFASQAQGDLTAAYNDAASRTPPRALPADIGGMTLTPGVYRTGATPALGLSGTLTLDGQGDPNAVFVFQVGSALITGVGSRVNLIGGAQPGNVFWQVGSSATLGTSSAFAGTILALTSISIDSGVTLDGRALARNGAVTLINDTINAPTTSTPPPTGLRVSTRPATRVTDHSARLNGLATVTEDSTAGKITFYAQLKRSGGPNTVSVSGTLPNKTGTSSLRVDFSKLPPCSSFRYRLVAHDNHGTVFGNYEGFKTSCPRKPIAYSIGYLFKVSGAAGGHAGVVKMREDPVVAC